MKNSFFDKKNIALGLGLVTVVALIFISVAVFDLLSVPKNQPYNPNLNVTENIDNVGDSSTNDWSGWGQIDNTGELVSSNNWYDLGEAVKYEMGTNKKEGVQSSQMANNLITKIKNNSTSKSNNPPNVNTDYVTDNNIIIDSGNNVVDNQTGYEDNYVGIDYGNNTGYPDNNNQEQDLNLTVDTQQLGVEVVQGNANEDFDVYKYVSKETPIIFNNKRDKIFSSLRNFDNQFVVVLQKGESFQQYLDLIVKEFDDKLLIDSMTYGKLSENDNNHYLVKVNYLITKYQMEEIRKYAKEFSDKHQSKVVREKINLLNTEIISKYSYSKNVSNIYSPYELYKNGKGVCQAYTSLAKIMLDEMGIENGIATGSLNGELHTWNVVRINGEELHIDFTLNDTRGNWHTLKTIQQISSDIKVSEIIF